MNVQILTPTGAATIKNAQSKKGLRAILDYMHTANGQKQPFIVLPPQTVAHDLVEITSVDAISY